MKNKVFTITFILILGFMSLTVRADEGVDAEVINPENEIHLNINESVVYFEHSIVNKDGRTFLPLREFCEALGITEISYDAAYKLIFIKKEDMSLVMAIDTEYYQMKEQIFKLDASPMLIDDTTYVPIRLVAEAFDFSVDWNNDTRTVILKKDDYEVPEKYTIKPEPKPEEKPVEAEKPVEPTYSEDDLYWLSKIVTVEARNLSYEGKLAIANVVYNRVKSPLYPNTVKDVIFQIDSGYVQFPPAQRAGFADMPAEEEAKKAALAALTGTNNIEDCLFFNNAPFSSKPEIFKVIEGEYFYK